MSGRSAAPRGRAKIALEKVGLYEPVRTLWYSVKRPEWWRRQERRRRFYRALFPGAGALCFDVGANVGNYTADLLALGACVVAVEPQAACSHGLRERFAGERRVAIVSAAVGPKPGSITMYTSDVSTIGSCSPEWIEAMKASGRFGEHDWATPVEVPMTTLDALVAEHGQPALCKIDVEGFELDVLRGLSRSIAMLSFEFSPETLDRTRECVEFLSRLGDYRFNFSVHDRFAFDAPAWSDAREFAERLRHLPEAALKWGGDVYARCGEAGPAGTA